MPSFYANFNLTDEYIDVYEEEFHHIHRVFRLAKGDNLNLINGKGMYANGYISGIYKNYVRIIINNVKEFVKSENRIACAFSLLKNKNDLLLVEKLTELGVSEFFPFISRYSVKNTKENTTEKMSKTAISAIKQCDNPYLPVIHKTQSLPKCLDIVIQEGYKPIVASERQKDFFLNDIELSGNICIVIGPEGGFHDDEFLLFEEKSISTISLGNHILRAETAAICSVSQIIFQNLCKDKKWF